MRKGFFRPAPSGIVGRVLVGGFAAGLCFLLGVSAQAQSSKRHPASHTSQKHTDTRLEQTLDDILASQETTLQKLDSITEELRIIKVRATSRGAISP